MKIMSIIARLWSRNILDTVFEYCETGPDDLIHESDWFNFYIKYVIDSPKDTFFRERRLYGERISFRQH